MRPIRLAVSLVLLVAALPFCSGCPKCTCPGQDCYIMGRSQFGPFIMEIPKGYFDDEKNYRTKEQMEELRKNSQPRRKAPGTRL